jgi:hypothetical protein
VTFSTDLPVLMKFQASLSRRQNWVSAGHLLQIAEFVGESEFFASFFRIILIFTFVHQTVTIMRQGAGIAPSNLDPI